jgi:hypothetical protein
LGASDKPATLAWLARTKLRIPKEYLDQFKGPKARLNKQDYIKALIAWRKAQLPEHLQGEGRRRKHHKKALKVKIHGQGKHRKHVAKNVRGRFVLA